MQKIFWGFLYLFSFHFVVAQPEYQLSKKVDISIGVAALAANATGIILLKNKSVLSLETINRLNRKDVWKPERFATDHWRPNHATASDVLLYTSEVLPLVLLASAKIRKDAPKIGLIYAETLLLNGGLTTLTKEIFKRKRPFNFNTKAPLDEKQKKDARSAFFSGHTSFSAAATFFLAKVYADYYPDSKWKPYVWSGAALFPLATGILRVSSGKHFPTDVFIGYLVGAATGVLVPHLHRKERKPQLFFP